MKQEWEGKMRNKKNYRQKSEKWKKKYQQRNKRGKVKKQSEIAHGFTK